MKRKELTKTKLKETLWSPWFIQKYFSVVRVNPCPAELLQLYFLSVEAGIANAISSFK